MKKNILITRLVVLILLIFAIGVIYYLSPQCQNFISSAIINARDPEAMKKFINSFGVFAPIIILFFTLLQAFITMIPLFIVMIASTMAFGLFWGIVYSLISQIIAAYIAFALTRYFGRPFVEHFAKTNQLKKIDDLIKSYGKWGILVVRMMPLGSYDLVNFAAGLLNINTRDYLIGTAIGCLPATILYGLFGSNIIATERINPWTYVALLVMIIFFIVVGILIRRKRNTKVKAVL